MNRFISTDTKLCIGCRTCEIACVMAHSEDNIEAIDPNYFHPRLKVMKEANATGPIMCRQCEGAPCANSCVHGAITQKGDSIHVDQEKCIGCNACAIACPYGVMTVTTRAIPQMIEGEQKGFNYISEALKCDLCTSRAAGPACIESCPTKALNIVEPKALMQAKSKRQLAALQAAQVLAQTNTLLGRS